MLAIPEENRRVNFTVKVEHANNRAFHWTLEGEGLTPDCVEGGQITGLSETVGQTVVVSILLRGDQAVKNLKNIRMIIRENGPTGNIVARSTLVTVNIIIPTKPPVKIGLIPIAVPFNCDGMPSWPIDQGNYPDAVENTNRIELKESLDNWGFEIGSRWFEPDGYTDPNYSGTWGPYYVLSYDTDTGAMEYERSYFNAVSDGISSIFKNFDAARKIEIAEMQNQYIQERKSCVMPFILRKEIFDEDYNHIGDRDFSKLDLVAELRVVGYEEFTGTWRNDPVFGHRAYSDPQGNTMIDCPLYKNVAPVDGTPLIKDFKPSTTSVEKCHLEWFQAEGRGYVQIPIHQISNYTYNEMTDSFGVSKLRNGYNARLKLTIKERTTGEVVSGLMFTVMQNDLLTNDTTIWTDRWAKQNLSGAVGEVIRVSEISPLYFEEPQRWVACDYVIEPDGSNIVIVGLEHSETPEEYAMDPQAPAPENIPYFTTPEVDEWPLGMTSKNIPLALSPVGAILHMQIRPMKLGDAMYPAADFSNLLWEIWEGSESYIDTIFHSSITEAAVAEWKNKRRPPAGEPFFSLYTTDKPGRLEITCNVLPTVMDRVLNSYIVIDFRNGYWATLDCDVTKLPSGYRIRINGSVVTSINLN